jgi:diguanylate cyclase (GGDEF)-like protein/PAS domain S-box-containing protein
MGLEMTDLKKKTRQQLIPTESREWYRTIAEDIPALVTRISPDYRITFANYAYCAFMGVSVEKVIGSDLSKFVPAENYQKVIDHLTALNPLRPTATHEHTNTAFDGSERWIKWTNRALFDHEEKLVEYLCIGEDITDYKQAFKKLKDSEAQKSSIIEASPDLIICHDSEGHYLDILSSSEDLLYLPRNELLGRKMRDLLPADLADKIGLAIQNALATGELQNMEYTLKTPSGKHSFESRIKSSSKNEVICFIRDVTEQKQIEKKMRESEERYREILASIEEGYYEVDLAGNIMFFNDALPRMIGFSREEFMGMSYKKLYKDPDTVFQTFHRVFLTGCPEIGFTLDIVKKNGDIAYGELSISLITDKNGQKIGFRGLARDITERVKFEQKLKFLSMHDQLTGLYNRAFFEEELSRLSQSREYPITLITTDLDDLKLINDSLGHEAGDRSLKAAADILKQSVRGVDILARVGGDEFAVILANTSAPEGEIIAARIREKIDLYNSRHTEMPLGLSIGLAVAPGPEKPLHEVFHHADDLMYRDKLYRSTRARNKSVQALLAALDERDYITQGHAQRLESLCRRMGEEVKLSSSQLADLALLAQVHDLGKVGIPDNILFKEGPLTAEEWEVMRLHPEKGYRIAITSPDLAEVADLILRHHEKWDGSGYPIKLKGEDIPIECRILAIVDAFDAMTNDRPYSKAKSREAAIEEIKNSAGTHFDPGLIDIFLSLV